MYKNYKEMYYLTNDINEIINKRLEMVKMAKTEGYKPTARYFKTDRNTVRKWARRYEENGIEGLKDRCSIYKKNDKRIKNIDMSKITKGYGYSKNSIN